jgi:hypothetical protein
MECPKRGDKESSENKGVRPVKVPVSFAGGIE